MESNSWWKKSRDSAGRKGRAWAIAVRRGSEKKTLSSEFSHISPEKKANSVLNFGSLKTF